MVSSAEMIQLELHERAVPKHCVITNAEHHRDIPLGARKRGSKILIEVRRPRPWSRSVRSLLTKPLREARDDSHRSGAEGGQQFGVGSVEARLENLLEQASKAGPSYAEFLDEVLSWEVDLRRTPYRRARLHEPASAR